MKRWFVEANTEPAFDGIGRQFREEAENLFSGDELNDHLQYVELLVDAAKK